MFIVHCSLKIKIVSSSRQSQDSVGAMSGRSPDYVGTKSDGATLTLMWLPWVTNRFAAGEVFSLRRSRTLEIILFVRQVVIRRRLCRYPMSAKSRYQDGETFDVFNIVC